MKKVYSCKDDFDPTSTTVSNAIRKILSDYSREVKVKIPTEEALSYVLSVSYTHLTLPTITGV